MDIKKDKPKRCWHKSFTKDSWIAFKEEDDIKRAYVLNYYKSSRAIEEMEARED